MGHRRAGIYRRALAALVLLCVLLAGCGGDDWQTQSAMEPAGSLPEQPAAGAEIALITTKEEYEQPFVQSAWSTISRVAGEAARSSGVYMEEAGADSLSTLEMAARGEAKLVVVAGKSLAHTAGNAQVFYPDLDFVFLDMPYDTPLYDNGVLVQFSPEQAGWLAGYAAVYEALGNIGFINDEKDELAQRYALGFLLGADAAAKERGAEAGSLRAYPVEADGTPRERESRVAGLYLEGPDMQVMFANAEAETNVVLRAAEEMGRRMVALCGMVEAPSLAVLAQVSHDPASVLNTLLHSWLEDRFPGGEIVEGKVDSGDVGLDIENSHLVRLNEQRYESVVDRFRLGTLANDIAARTARNDDGELSRPEALALEAFTVGPPLEEEPASSVSGQAPPVNGGAQPPAADEGSAPAASEAPPAQSSQSAAGAVVAAESASVPGLPASIPPAEAPPASGDAGDAAASAG